MKTADALASELADEWLEMMSAISWADHARSMVRRWPAPCGETTSIQTGLSLLDVSESYEWVTDGSGDIKLTIEVFDEPGEPSLATRINIIRAPANGN